jgi:phenylalanine-4-hydroxylase
MQSLFTQKNWSDEEQATWAALAKRQKDTLSGKVIPVFFDALEQLGISTNHLPDLREVDTKLQKTSGWKLVNSSLEFADGQSWFESLQRNEFLVTDYIRPLNSLDYTPKPDVFHDVFGHLPFLVNPQISRIIRKFTTLMLCVKPDERVRLGHIWWFTIEFGLVKARDKVLALGAGLASSFGELNQVFTGKTKLLPFDPEVIGRTAESSSEFHPQLFVLESLDQLEELLEIWPLQEKQ